MLATRAPRRSLRVASGLGAGIIVFALALLGSWTAQRRFEAFLDRLDAGNLDAASKVLDELVAERGRELASTVAVLSGDARVRAMVLTPTFDRATVLDLLGDLKVTSSASLTAILDGEGTVRAVVGAPEMDQLDLGTSSLVKSAVEKASARVWAFDGEVGVLAVTPVRVDRRVLALFMMGSKLDDALLQRVERALGATGAVFLVDQMVASASREPAIEHALRAAAALPPGSYGVVADKFLAINTPLRDSAAGATVAWLVPLYRHTDGLMLTRALAWVPTALICFLLVFMMGLIPSRHEEPSSTHQT